jgi:hypothetical protein
VAELPFWQLFAGIVSGVFVLLGALGVLRLTRLAMVVIVVGLLGLPAIGFAAYALNPGPVGDFGFTGLGLAFALLAALALGVNLARRATAGRAPTFADVHGGLPFYLLAWLSLVGAITSVLAILEPGFAIANVALNLGWLAIWAPRFARRQDRSSSYEIAAPRERVFAFTTDPANWPLYNPTIESVEVNPPGPLAPGSQVTVKQRLSYAGLRGPRVLMPGSVRATSAVTALIPGRLLSSQRVDLPDSSDSVELTDAAHGTRVDAAIKLVIPYRLAVLGACLSALLNRRKLDELVKQRQDNLKSLLEDTSPPAP